MWDKEVPTYIALSIRDASDININGHLSDKLLANDDIEEYWSVLARNWSENESILSMIIDHWINAWGFAHSRNLMEKYKKSKSQRELEKLY